MRARYWTIFGCLMLSAGGVFALEADKIFEKLESSIWVVTTFDEQERRIAQATAVVVAQGRLVTNCHVLAKARSVTVKRANVAYSAKLEHVDTERDLCQLRAADLPASAVAIAPGDSLKVGQKVFALQSPRGAELSLVDGLVSSLRKSPDGDLESILTTAPVAAGSSGGGLVDIDGRLVGIMTSGRRESQNLTAAIPAAWISELPQRSKEALAKDAQQRVLAESATVQIKAFVERQITQQELVEHFKTPRRVTATTTIADNVMFMTYPNGVLEFRSNVVRGLRLRASYKLRVNEGQMCITVPALVNSDANRFQWMRGCYRLFATGPDQYMLRNDTDKYFIKYGS
jgi:hypothetical protein